MHPVYVKIAMHYYAWWGMMRLYNGHSSNSNQIPIKGKFSGILFHDCNQTVLPYGLQCFAKKQHATDYMDKS